MTARLVVVAVLALGSAPALADSHKLLVLQSEGRVDAATRAKIDAAIVKLAAATEPHTAAGDLNFTDAATAVGCKPDTASCKAEVLGTLSVDEIVITSVAPKPGGIEIVVRRIARGGASREATMLLATGTSPDKLDGIAPLFEPLAPAPAGPPAPAPGAPAPGAPAPGAPAPGAPAVVAAPASEPAVAAAPAAHDPSPALAAPPPVLPSDDRTSARRHNLEIIGMAGGGGMVVVGLLLWGAASGVQSDINKAPTTTAKDLASLRELESRGDRYATFGNLFAIGGLAVGGVATYFYVRDRRTGSTASARITPAVLPHGAGLVLTIGETP